MVKSITNNKRSVNKYFQVVLKESTKHCSALVNNKISHERPTIRSSCPKTGTAGQARPARELADPALCRELADPALRRELADPALCRELRGHGSCSRHGGPRGRSLCGGGGVVAAAALGLAQHLRLPVGAEQLGLVPLPLPPRPEALQQRVHPLLGRECQSRHYWLLLPILHQLSPPLWAPISGTQRRSAARRPWCRART